MVAPVYTSIVSCAKCVTAIEGISEDVNCDRVRREGRYRIGNIPNNTLVGYS